MNEFERMKAGDWLHAVCPSIGRELQRAEMLCFRFNQLPPDRLDAREAMLRELLGHMGEGCLIHSPFHCDFGTQIRTGDGAVIGAGSVVTHDIPPQVIAAGNPCRVLRPITEKDRIREVY